MKDPFDRTKAVLRHLPPTLSQSALMEQIDARFAGRYRWFYFRPEKNSQKHHRYSRAYIDFKKPEDVVDFAEFFDGHVFVNEKGGQFKVVVEYAPSQRVPKSWSKKDSHEGTIFKDSKYLEFLELLAKPVENLPSAEIQLERREAERAGATKATLKVTPLMDFVRKKRAAKGVSQRQSSNEKLNRRGVAASPGNSSSVSTKRGSAKRRVSTSMHVLRGISKNTFGKDKSAYILMPRREDQQLSDKSIFVAGAIGTEILEDQNIPGTDGTISGVAGADHRGKKKVLLLKGKEPVISQQQSVTSPVRNSPGSTAFKQNQRHEAGGRIIRSILSNKEARQSQSSTEVESEQHILTLPLEKEKRPPRSTNMRSVLKDYVSNNLQAAWISDMKTSLDDRVTGNDLQGFSSISEKQDKHTRNKDKPDRGIWTPLRRSDGLHANDESLSTSSSLSTQLLSDSLEGMNIAPKFSPGVTKTTDDVVEDIEFSNRSSFVSGKPRLLDTVHKYRLGRGSTSQSTYDLSVSQGEMKFDMPNTSRSEEVKILGSGRSNYSFIENGTHKHVGRRGPAHGVKDFDGFINQSEGKPLKRAGATGYGFHEKQVWVQKSGSGS